MKKYITLAALLAAGAAVANADTLTLKDQWTFDDSLESKNGRTFSDQQVGTNYADGALELTLNYNGASGIYLNDDNTLGLTEGNWAIQITMNLEKSNSSNTAQVLTCLNNVDGGTQVAISNPADGGVYGLCTNGWGSWGAPSRTNAETTTGSLTTLTVLNYNGALYLAQGKTWATFGTGNAKTENFTVGDNVLGKLTFGFGRNGENGLSAQTIVLNDISVYEFDTNTANLVSVKTALIANAIPEPSAFGLLAGLGALALVGTRRRRK